MLMWMPILGSCEWSSLNYWKEIREKEKDMGKEERKKVRED